MKSPLKCDGFSDHDPFGSLGDDNPLFPLGTPVRFRTFFVNSKIGEERFMEKTLSPVLRVFHLRDDKEEPSTLPDAGIPPRFRRVNLFPYHPSANRLQVLFPKTPRGPRVTDRPDHSLSQ